MEIRRWGVLPLRGHPAPTPRPCPAGCAPPLGLLPSLAVPSFSCLCAMLCEGLCWKRAHLAPLSAHPSNPSTASPPGSPLRSPEQNESLCPLEGLVSIVPPLKCLALHLKTGVSEVCTLRETEAVFLPARLTPSGKPVQIKNWQDPSVVCLLPCRGHRTLWLWPSFLPSQVA